VIVDKVFAECLKRYAALIAKFVLGKRSAGTNLSDDIKVSKANSIQTRSTLKFNKLYFYKTIESDFNKFRET
jgi:hypothetical protein